MSRIDLPGPDGASPYRVEIRPRPGLFDFDLGAVWNKRELLFFLIWRDLKVRYAQAALGVGWAVLQPLLTVLIFSLIFGAFAKLPSDGLPYPVFAFAAVLPWTYFSEATRRGSFGLVGDSGLIQKVYFPRLIIPLSNVVTPLADFAVTFVVLLVLMAWYGILPGWQVVFAPVFVAMMFLLALGISLWLGPINVRYRDVAHTMPLLLQIWMYATPIVYPLSLVPERWKALYSLNPMVGIIEGFRWALLGRGSVDLQALVSSAVVIVLLVVGGLVWFRRAERNFADVI